MVVKAEKNALGATEPELSEELQLKVKKYLRGDGANLESLKDKKLKGQLAVREALYGHSAKAAAKAEKWLMPEEAGYLEAEGLEKTWRFKQEAIVNEVDALSSRKAFDMILPDEKPVAISIETDFQMRQVSGLPLMRQVSGLTSEIGDNQACFRSKVKVLGPYKIGYTLSGRYMLIAGRKGHLGMIDMLSMDLVKEFQVKETVRDAIFLHNEQLFAVAQKKYPYIYNRDGIEIHCLKENISPLKLQFLDKHFLLVSVNKTGLYYQDVSTGSIVANFRTGFGRTDVMRTNPYNSVIGLGHSGGKVTMWKPTSSKPLVTMLCHHGPVTAIAFHGGGHLMATAGTDRKIKLWDLRKFEVLKSYQVKAVTMDFSQKGLLAMASGSRVEVWRDSIGDHDYRCYMCHSIVKGYQIGKVAFRPYEDVLGIGHSTGLSSILIPGAGEPNFDSWLANPFETPRQRREKEVRALLDKLPSESIMLDPSKIGTIMPPKKKEKPSKQELEVEMQVAIEAAKNASLKKKTKGRNKPSKRAIKRKDLVVQAKRTYLDQQMDDKAPLKKQRISEAASVLPKSLQRFARTK